MDQPIDRDLTPGAVDMSVAINSAIASVQMHSLVGLQVIWASGASPIGVLKVRGSHAKGQNSAGQQNAPPAAGDASWSDVPGLTFNLAANAGEQTFTDPDVSYNWVMVVWTPSSGAATLTSIRLTAKQR